MALQIGGDFNRYANGAVALLSVDFVTARIIHKGLIR